MGQVRFDCLKIKILLFKIYLAKSTIDKPTWMDEIYLEPFVDAFGVIFVATGENAKRLTSFEFAHANDASALATFFDLARKSIRRQLIDLRTRQSPGFGFTQPFSCKEKKNPKYYFLLFWSQSTTATRKSRPEMYQKDYLVYTVSNVSLIPYPDWEELRSFQSQQDQRTLPPCRVHNSSAD